MANIVCINWIFFQVKIRGKNTETVVQVRIQTQKTDRATPERLTKPFNKLPWPVLLPPEDNVEGGRPCFEDPSRISVITPNVEALWRGGIEGGGPLEGVVFFLVLSHCSTCKKSDFITALELDRLDITMQHQYSPFYLKSEIYKKCHKWF